MNYRFEQITPSKISHLTQELSSPEVGGNTISTISGPPFRTSAGSNPLEFKAEKKVTVSPVIITVTEPPLVEINLYFSG